MHVYWQKQYDFSVEGYRWKKAMVVVESDSAEVIYQVENCIADVEFPEKNKKQCWIYLIYNQSVPLSPPAEWLVRLGTEKGGQGER